MQRYRHHRLPGFFFIMLSPFRGTKKSLFPILGNKDRKDNFCGTTLFAIHRMATSARCQHTGCPLTLAMRQKILGLAPVPPALGGPLYRIAFRSALSSAELSVDALPALLPPQWFRICYALYTLPAPVCQGKIFQRRTNVRCV